ncbi:MAG: DUF1801 domain-containing protein [Anaerolineae bacterium]
MNDQVQRFMNAVPEDRKPLFDRLHALILSLYPDAQIVISYQVPTYKVKSGWVALGYWKAGVSLYTNNPQHIAEFAARHPHIKTNKASINLKLTDEVPMEDLEQVIRHAMEGTLAS